MEAIPKEDLPAACADCITAMQLKAPGVQIPKEMPSKWLRSADGKVRYDMPDMSIISDPKARQTIILDHLKKQVRRIPMPDAPQAPDLPQVPMPGMPAIPQAPNVQVEDLGQAMLDGIAVQGKRYVAKLPPPPQAPKLPNMPEPPVTTEVWSSVKDKLPILTKIKGKFGEQICKCKFVVGEPSPDKFQIPADYAEVAAMPEPPPIPKAPVAEPPKIDTPKLS